MVCAPAATRRPGFSATALVALITCFTANAARTNHNDDSMEAETPTTDASLMGAENPSANTSGGSCGDGDGRSLAEVNEGTFESFMQTMHKTSAGITSTYRSLGSCQTDIGNLMEQSPFLKRGAMYKVKCLGEGGMAQVWKVCSKRCSVCLALKVAWDRGQRRLGKFREKLRHEHNFLKMARRHPNFVNGVDSYEITKPMAAGFYLMELVEGGNLQELVGVVPGERKIGRKDIAILLDDIIAAVGQMHAHHVVHGDLKPENVFVTGPCDGDAQCHGKVADFGIACIEPYEDMSEDDQRMAVCGKEEIGTPAYLPPEMWAGGRRTTKLDTWAISLIAYSLAFGGPPRSFLTQVNRKDLGKVIRSFNITSDRMYKENCNPHDPLCKLIEAGLRPFRKRASISWLKTLSGKHLSSLHLTNSPNACKVANVPARCYGKGRPLIPRKPEPAPAPNLWDQLLELLRGLFFS